MCEQTVVEYLEGDIVWVKLGACWWPGKVREVDKLPDDILESFRKKPIAAVQFFNEDKYEYVKNLEQICRYNCRRKNEFIKKGLDMHRSKQKEGSSFMDKFPNDVSIAEELTGGNPEIITDIAFAPEEKPNYRNIFGDKKTEKKGKHANSPSKNSSPWKSKMSPSSQRSSCVTPSHQHRPITHPRIIRMLKGEKEDHDVRIRQQPATPTVDFSSPEEPYKCYKCDFTSKRLNVIIMHSKSHSNEEPTNGQTTTHLSNKINTPRPRGRPPNIVSPRSGSSPKNRNRISSYTQSPKLFSPKSAVSVDMDDEKPKEMISSEKKSPKTPVLGKRKSLKVAGEKITKKKKSSEDFKEKLLAEWGDEDPEEEEKEMQILKQELSRSETMTSPERAEDQKSTIKNSTVNVKPKEISCFDFDEKADSLLDHELEERAKKFAEARKFPRINEDKTENDRKIDNINSNVGDKVSEPRVPIPEDHRVETVPKEIDKHENKDLSTEFENIMAETTLPSLPSVPEMRIKSNEESEEENLVQTSSEISKDKGDKDHDYSAKKKEDSLEFEGHELLKHEDFELPKEHFPEQPPQQPSEEHLPEEHPLERSFEQPLEQPEEILEPLPGEKISLCTENISEQPISQPQLSLDDMELDINSMPVVMSDTLITNNTSKESIEALVSADVSIPSMITENSAVIPKTVEPTVTLCQTTTLSSTTLALTPNIEKVSDTNTTVEKSLTVMNTSPKTVKQTVKIQPGMSNATVATTRTTEGSNTPQKSSAVSRGYVLIQHSPSGKQQTLYSGQKPMSQCMTLKTVSNPQGQNTQQTIGKKIFLLKPPSGGNMSQEILTTALSQNLGGGGKIVPQCIITKQGTILKQVSGRNAKVMTVTPQQMKALTGKTVGGAKLTMQSTPTKVVLPTVSKLVTQTTGTKTVGVAGSSKSKSNTILIQTTQGTTVGNSILPRGSSASLAGNTSGQTKLSPVSQAVVKQVTSPRSKLTTSTASPGATVQRVVVSSSARNTIQSSQIQQKILTTSTLQPRIVQKSRPARMPNVGAIAGIQQQQQVKTVQGLLSRTQILQKPKQTQVVKKLVTVQQPNIKSPSADIAQTITLPLQPVQPEVTVSPNIQQSFQANIVIPSSPAVISPNLSSQSGSMPVAATSAPLLSHEHIAQVITPSGSDQVEGGTATYVLVTIDDSGAIQPYDSSGLVTYDGNNQATDANTKTLYIDPSSLSSSGDLENIFLAINNSAPGGTGTLLNLGQANTISTTNIPTVSTSQTTFNVSSSQTAVSAGASQDILAAALANTDVFQPEGSTTDSLTVVNSSQSAGAPVMTSRLLEPSSSSAATASLLTVTSTTIHQGTVLLPSISSSVLPTANAAGVLETSLTLNQPIMTPLEVPSSVTNLSQPPPPIPTSLELPLTITQPVLSMPSTSAYPSISHTLTGQVQDADPVSSSTISQISSQPVLSSRSTLQASMPLLSEDVTESQITEKLEDPIDTNIFENQAAGTFNQMSKNNVQTGIEQESNEKDDLPSYAQVPEVSSHITDEQDNANDEYHVGHCISEQSYHDMPESTSEANESLIQENIDSCETHVASEHTVSTSYARGLHNNIVKDRSEAIDSSEPPVSEPSVPNYTSIENTSEAIAVKNIASEAQNMSDPTCEDIVSMPYEQVESTSHIQENTSDGNCIIEASPELSTVSNAQSFVQAPESTSSASGEVVESNCGTYSLPSYSETPESTSEVHEGIENTASESITESYSQIPESTSHISEVVAVGNSPMDILDSSQHSLDSSILTPYQVPESSSEASVSYDESHLAPDATAPNADQIVYTTCSQVPESTSQIHDVLSFSDSSTEVSDCVAPLVQSMPLLLDTSTGSVERKRHLERDGTDSMNDLNHSKRARFDETER